MYAIKMPSSLRQQNLRLSFAHFQRLNSADYKQQQTTNKRACRRRKKCKQDSKIFRILTKFYQFNKNGERFRGSKKNSIAKKTMKNKTKWVIGRRCNSKVTPLSKSRIKLTTSVKSRSFFINFFFSSKNKMNRNSINKQLFA